MNIVVCIKQVPDTKGGVKFNPDGTLDRAAIVVEVAHVSAPPNTRSVTRIPLSAPIAIASRSTSSAFGRPMS